MVVALEGSSALALPAQNPAVLWQALARPTFDPSQVAVVEGVQLTRDAAEITLVNGQVALGQILAGPSGEGRRFHAAFKGSGRFQLTPTLPLERQQLTLHSGQPVLYTEFEEAVFLFTDDTADELAAQATFQSGDPGGLQKICHGRINDWTDDGLNMEARLLKGLLADDPSPHTIFVAALKTPLHGWLTVMVDAADPEEVELWHFDRNRRAVTVWAKFPARGRTPQEVFADPAAHLEYQLKGYTLDVTVEGTELRGQAAVELALRRPGERVLLLSLDPNLRVSEVKTESGESLAFFQPRDPKDDFFLGDYLVVAAATPFPPGPLRLHFTYSGERVVRKVGAGNYFCRSFGWYPSYSAGRYSLTTNEFADRLDFDITLRVDKEYDVAATGRKTDEREEGKRKITRWKSAVPLAVAGFTFGDYKIQTDQSGGARVEVYANRRPDDIMRSIEVAAAGPVIRSSGTTQLSRYALGSLSPSRLAKEMSVEVANSLKVFESFFGPYPYEKLAVSNIPYSYGQGWPSLLYLSSLSFLDSNQRQQLGIQDHVWLTDFFRAHETSHQWWGHAVGWKSYHDQWLSEGFAEYSGILYTLIRRNPEEHFRLLREDRRDLLLADEEGATYEHLGPIYAGRRLRSGKHPGGYRIVVYKKGGWVLHMLRMMLYAPANRENPDAAFMAMMRDFTRSYQNQAASTEDFKAVVERHMTPAMDLEGNGKMDWFFNSWVYGTGIPKYRLNYSLLPAPGQGQYVLRGILIQSEVPDDFRSIVPLYLHADKGFIRAGWLGVTGPRTPFEMTLPFKPTKVTINEWEDVLANVE